MPTPKVIALATKLHAVSLIDSGKASIRSAASTVGLAKSTLHDNLPRFRKSTEEFVGWHGNAQRRFVRNTLSIAMEGKSSSRDTATILSRIEGRQVDHHEVLDVLGKASRIAEAENSKKVKMRLTSGVQDDDVPPLSKVRCAAFDEIFQCRKPILSFVEPVSGFCHLAAAEDRTADTWEKQLEKLKILGLNPRTTNTDGGQGLLKGLRTVYPDSINLRDLFHVIAKLGKALRAFEGCCYRCIDRADKLARSGEHGSQSSSIIVKMERTIALFDALESMARRFRCACYCENDWRYVNSDELSTLVKRIVALIECAERNRIQHRAIKEARTYLQGSAEEIVAYKKQLEIEIRSQFGEVGSLSVLDSICPMIEFLDQIQRSYENRVRRDFWGEKLADARARFRKIGIMDQGELDAAINRVAQTMIGLRKSNSMVEAINSVIRRFLVTYKSIPKWFCPLFTLFWNHRTMARGKRKGLKPCEILTGKAYEQDWLDLILDRWECETTPGTADQPAPQLAVAG